MIYDHDTAVHKRQTILTLECWMSKQQVPETKKTAHIQMVLGCSGNMRTPSFSSLAPQKFMKNWTHLVDYDIQPS